MTDLDELKALIIDGAASHGRSQQRALGPSEVGHPCLRKLAYGLMGVPKCNSYSDPLPSVVGTGAHAQVEEFARKANERLGRTRWLPETRVTVRPGLAGTCDLVDLDTTTVIDWKFPGTSRMHHYRTHGPSEVYRRQAHLYGRGMRNLGLPITDVGICFLPRGGELKNAYLWTEPYSDAVVAETLSRIDAVTLMLDDFDIDHHPENYQRIPATPDGCFVCPYHRSTPSGPYECNGGTPTDPGATAPVPQGAFAL